MLVSQLVAIGFGVTLVNFCRISFPMNNIRLSLMLISGRLQVVLVSVLRGVELT